MARSVEGAAGEAIGFRTEQSYRSDSVCDYFDCYAVERACIHHVICGSYGKSLMLWRFLFLHTTHLQPCSFLITCHSSAMH
jgi:hypothetical protein